MVTDISPFSEKDPKKDPKKKRNPRIPVLCHFRWVESEKILRGIYTRNGRFGKLLSHRWLGATLQARLESITCPGRSVGEPLSAIAAVETLGRGLGFFCDDVRWTDFTLKVAYIGMFPKIGVGPQNGW